MGLSLNHLAASTGLHKSFLSRIESGAVRQPATDSLRRIAEALELPETELYGLLDRRTRDLLPPLQVHRAPDGLTDAIDQELESRQEHSPDGVDHVGVSNDGLLVELRDSNP